MSVRTSTAVYGPPEPRARTIVPGRHYADMSWLIGRNVPCTAAPELFTSTHGELEGDRNRRERAAKAICAGCDVRDQCLEAALADEHGVGDKGREGVWGGTTPAERTALMKRSRQRRRAAAELLRRKGAAL